MQNAISTIHTVLCDTSISLTFLKPNLSKSCKPPWPHSFGKALWTCALRTLTGKRSLGSTVVGHYLGAFYLKFKTSFKQHLILNNLHQKKQICTKWNSTMKGLHLSLKSHGPYQSPRTDTTSGLLAKGRWELWLFPVITSNFRVEWEPGIGTVCAVT